MDRAAFLLTLADVIRQQVVSDNPIRRFLETIGVTSNPDTNVAEFEQELQGRIQRAHTIDQLIAVWKWAENLQPLPALPLLSLAEKLAEHECWDVSVQVLRAATAVRPNDFEIHRQLGFHLRHVDNDEEARREFEKALDLNPHDPETLGMLGGLLKRQGRFGEALRHYDHGAALVPSSQYMRVNQAALAILASPGDPGKGVKLYGALLADIEKDPSSQSDVWAQLVAGEAAFAVGRSDAVRFFDQALKLASTRKPLRSAAEQLELFASVRFHPDEARTLAAHLNASPQIVAVVEGLPAAPTPSWDPASMLPVVIHLSDPHFGSLKKDGKSIDMHRFYDGDYSSRLSISLCQEFKSKRPYFRLRAFVGG